MGGCLSSTQEEVQQESERNIDPIGPLPFSTTEDWLREVQNNRLHLSGVPQPFRHDKRIVIAAVQQDGMQLQWARHFKDDRDVAIVAVKQNGRALRFVSKDLRNDKEIVIAAIRRNAYALKYASQSKIQQLRDLNDIFSYASTRLQNDKDMLRHYWLKRVQLNGMDLQDAPEFFRGDAIIAAAAINQNSKAANFVTPEAHDVVHWMPLVEQNERYSVQPDLGRAPENIRKDTPYVYETVQKIRMGQNIHDAVYEYWYNRMKRNGLHLEYAPDHMKKDMSLVLAAVKKNPNAIKYAHGTLKRDPEVLAAAGMFDVHHDDAVTRQQQYQHRNDAYEKIVLSTRFSLNPSSHSDATNFTKLLKANEYVRNKGFTFYAPNAFDKKTCDKNWTDFDWPCRGTKDTCQYNNLLTENGHPTDDCCWRAVRP